jgi:hypothetical protein
MPGRPGDPAERLEPGAVVERYLAAAEMAGATAVSIPWGQVATETTGDAHSRGLLMIATERSREELLGKVAAGLDG